MDDKNNHIDAASVTLYILKGSWLGKSWWDGKLLQSLVHGFACYVTPIKVEQPQSPEDQCEIVRVKFWPLSQPCSISIPPWFVSRRRIQHFQQSVCDYVRRYSSQATEENFVTHLGAYQWILEVFCRCYGRFEPTTIFLRSWTSSDT